VPGTACFQIDPTTGNVIAGVCGLTQ
jgi:hypothetical protein